MGKGFLLPIKEDIPRFWAQNRQKSATPAKTHGKRSIKTLFGSKPRFLTKSKAVYGWILEKPNLKLKKSSIFTSSWTLIERGNFHRLDKPSGWTPHAL